MQLILRDTEVDRERTSQARRKGRLGELEWGRERGCCLSKSVLFGHHSQCGTPDFLLLHLLFDWLQLGSPQPILAEPLFLSEKSTERGSPRGDALLKKTRLTRDTHSQSNPGISLRRGAVSKGRLPRCHEFGVIHGVSRTPPASGPDSPPTPALNVAEQSQAPSVSGAAVSVSTWGR